MKVYPDVKDVEEFKQQPGDYQIAVKKVVRSHAINELYGSQVFDEPAIALAPTPHWKWLSCRVAMEEFHHHIRFRELADQIGVKSEEMDTKNKRPLSVFEFKMKTFEEFCVIKAVADLGEVLQVEDLMHCSFVPLRNIARATLPEEKFHCQFGHDFCKEFMQKPGGREKLQQALDRFFPLCPAFFGSAGSKNNEMLRKYGIKFRRNEEMRSDYMARVRVLVEDKLGLRLPEVKLAA
ncbi:MAG: phenylacetate-CoA oxygenase subunit PaaI [Betaproteobacteria bacterium]|nr:phenylacetate-CoA oxygenase subunit PaaI [Betaproteobacteria bacterium]